MDKKEFYEESIADYLNFLDDDKREEWLEKLLNSPIKVMSSGMSEPVLVDIKNDEERQTWLEERKDAMTEIAIAKKIFTDISDEPFNGIPLDFIAMQRGIYEAKMTDTPINEHYDAMLLILKYYDYDGALFAIGDKLRNSPNFLAEVITRMHPDALGHDALDLIGVEDSTWAKVAKIVNDDKLKSKLLSNRIKNENFEYDLIKYYEENASKYGLDETLKYNGFLEADDIPMPNCNDELLFKYLLQLEDEKGNIAFSYQDLSYYFGSEIGENFKRNAALYSLRIRDQKLEKEKTEEKKITEVEALIEKQTQKEGQDIGEN